ncbi:phosphatidylinositol-specific phospholipase C domain-containing protein [Chitinophaga oryziterrae]|uniref:1-phosphatidylinositol phosphodiesterase n=1 Tax=Chitinophaga oryziterrae TaxID=1031224 RepID=A0A6N8JFD2_9BACT|nr:phosphatidylinositol-specific phospholipase C [Chitinophaga oryziterrae]MVT43897.1 phosphatidylinositol-specific phospholipase C domain-containing protein [Chitinophaga oryziterrae]
MRNTRLMFAAGMLLAVSFSSCKKEDVTPDLSLNKEVAVAQATTVATNNWMTSLPDNSSLAALSIPGTHDSGARFEPVSGTAKCQNLTIAEQLEAGIRFLDIRCRHIGDAFAIHHGSIYQNQNFNDVMLTCTAFLNNHPGECIVMCVKEEYDATNNTRTFEQTFDAYVQTYSSYWSLGATIPSLGQVRGKIVLLRRFGAAATPKGIDATAWADNTTFTISNSNASLRVQDQYVVPDNTAKWNNISALLNEAKTLNPAVLYVNFTSGYKSLIFSIPSITTVSNSINPSVTTYFTSNTHGRFGIIPMDFAESARATLIYNTNF